MECENCTRLLKKLRRERELLDEARDVIESLIYSLQDVQKENYDLRTKSNEYERKN